MRKKEIEEEQKWQQYMKNVDQIIGYIDGIISVLKGFEPKRVELYVLRDILNYIKEDENDK